MKLFKIIKAGLKKRIAKLKQTGRYIKRIKKKIPRVYKRITRDLNFIKEHSGHISKPERKRFAQGIYKDLKKI